MLAQGTLTNAEAKDLRPQLLRMIEGGTDAIDDFLTDTNRQKAEAEIWSSMDDEDMETLVDTLLHLGRRTTVAAGVVRATAQGYLNIQALIIILPRLLATARWYPQHGGFSL